MIPGSKHVTNGFLTRLVIIFAKLRRVSGAEFSTLASERPSSLSDLDAKMMLALLVYNYAVGRMSSRQIEKATCEDVASRYTCSSPAVVAVVVVRTGGSKG